MQSNVGNSQVYNDGDQRNYSKEEQMAQDPPRFEGGNPNSHDLLDKNDNRSLRNTLEAAEKKERDEEIAEQEDSERDPREAAERHGNAPSKGAQIDAELKEADEEILKKKGAL